MESIELKNIKVNNIINDFNLKITNKNISIVASTGMGKTTLCNVLLDIIDYAGSYLINNKKSSKSSIKKYIEKVNNDDININNKVVDYLFDTFNDNTKVVEEATNEFNIKGILTKKISELELSKRVYIITIASIIKNKKYLIIDNILDYMTTSDISKIYKYAKKKKITIINFTSKLDSVLFSNYMVVLYNKEVAMEGETKACLKEEKLLKRLGYDLPFMYDLSTQLNYYDVIDEYYEDMSKMVKNIWN